MPASHIQKTENAKRRNEAQEDIDGQAAPIPPATSLPSRQCATKGSDSAPLRPGASGGLVPDVTRAQTLQ